MTVGGGAHGAGDAPLRVVDPTLPRVATAAAGAPEAVALADTIALGATPPIGGDDPAVIGRYQVTGRLGAGGMGAVYAAHDPLLDRLVAVKLLHRDDRPSRGERLLDEAQAMAKLSHPNVAQVYEAGTHEGQVFIAMELIHGITLRAWLDAAPRGVAAIVERFVAAGRGLQAAHAAGVVHRDFKPDNVLVGDDGRVVVVDFGVARLGRTLLMPRGGASSDSGGAAQAGLGGSVDGRIVGTPAYMSPEQWLGGSLDARSDVFSFCVALFEAIHGRRPFAGNNAVDLARNVLSGTIVALPRGRAPRWLDRLLRRGLAVHPERRFPSMEALLGELARDRQRRRRRWLLGGAALGLAGGLGFGVAALRPEDPCGRAGERVHEVWNPARRAAIREALVGGGARYAEATWERVDERLDAYAGAWERGARDACAATRVRGEASEELLDRRSACLSTRLRALEAALVLFEREGAAALDRAVDALAGLPAIELCADEQHVRERLPPPPTAAIAAAVEALRDRLAELRAAVDAGDPRRVLGELDRLGHEAEALAYRPALAEVLVVRSLSLARLAEPDAAAALTRAYHEAVASGHDEAAFEAALNLAILGATDADAWITVTAALTERLQASDYQQARFHYVRLLRACKDGECDEPIDPLLAAIDRHRRLVGDGHPTLARLEGDLANIHMLRRDHARAEEAYTAALRLNEAILGPAHPRLLGSLGNLARLALQREDLTAAAAYIARTREVLGDDFAPNHPYVIGLRRIEADLAEARGDIEAAAATLDRLVADAGASRASLVHGHRLHLAVLRRLLGRRAAAREGLCGADVPRPEAPGERLDVAIFCGLLAAELGDNAAARARLEEAAGLAASGTPTALMGRLHPLAEALAAAAEGDRPAAIAGLQALLDGDRPPELVGEAQAALARMIAAEDPERARQLAAAADQALSDSPAHQLLRRQLAEFAAGLPAAAAGPLRPRPRPRR